MNSEMMSESLRTFICTMIMNCKNDDELIEMCVELEQIIDTIRKNVNERHAVTLTRSQYDYVNGC